MCGEELVLSLTDLISLGSRSNTPEVTDRRAYKIVKKKKKIVLLVEVLRLPNL